MTIQTSIRVADAPLLDRRGAPHNAGAATVADSGIASVLPSSPMFAGLLVFALIYVTKFLYIRGTEPWTPALTLGRYLLWPAILVAVAVHVHRRGLRDLRRNTAYLVPFVVIGMISAYLGVWPVESVRLIVFWLMCTLCAAAVGAEVDVRTARSVLFWSFTAIILICIAAVIVVPDMATRTATRYELGYSWRGLFTGKNVLGLVAVYAILMAVFAQEQARWLRIVAGGLATVTLVFTASQGSIVTAVAACGYLGLIALLRRSALSAGVRATVLGVGTISTVLGLYFLAGPILEALGRDPTLTGRTYIWAAFFERARALWPIGGGPGSFSNAVSPYVADLAFRFKDLGNINTPHNMYITALGEIGVFGLIAFMAPVFYFAFVLPFRKEAPAALAVATVAFTMIVGGMSEAREVFGIGLNMFLLVLMVAILHRGEREAAAAGAVADPDMPDAPTRLTPVPVPTPDDAWRGPRLLGA